LQFPVPYDSKPPFKKTQLKPRLKTCRCIPPEQDSAFVAAMEDVLAVYARPYNSKWLLVCMDGKPYQLLGLARPSLPLEPGSPCREDFE